MILTKKKGGKRTKNSKIKPETSITSYLHTMNISAKYKEIKNELKEFAKNP